MTERDGIARRTVLAGAGIGMAGMALADAAGAAPPPARPIDEGRAAGG